MALTLEQFTNEVNKELKRFFDKNGEGGLVLETIGFDGPEEIQIYNIQTE